MTQFLGENDWHTQWSTTASTCRVYDIDNPLPEAPVPKRHNVAQQDGHHCGHAPSANAGEHLDAISLLAYSLFIRTYSCSNELVHVPG